MLILAISRVIVFLVALKTPPTVCRAYFYIEVMICALSTFAPRQAHQEWEYMAQSYLVMTVLNFCLFYCDLWPSLLCSGLVNICVLASAVLVYDKVEFSFNDVGLFIIILIYQ